MRYGKTLPTAQKILRGNPGKRPLNSLEPKPPKLSGMAVPPEIARDRVAAAEWDRLAPMLHACRQITEADKSTLLTLCRNWSRYLEADANARPAVIDGKTNPWVHETDRALKQCIRLWGELGLTPASRSRVHMAETPPPGGDSFSEFDDTPPPAGALEALDEYRQDIRDILDAEKDDPGTVQ